MELFKNIRPEKGYITAAGLMSGTSLDGLDIALCRFGGEGFRQFEIIDATTVLYDEDMKKQLRTAGTLSARDFIALHRKYGQWTGEQVNMFLKRKNIHVDIIASHGHTVFHEPDKKLNFQIGDGTMIAAATGITTVSDFRTFDIALGGQGAPLIPIVDRDLFSQYDACVNLGGFANVSLKKGTERKAWDICPVNIILNKLAGYSGQDFDKNGETGKKGKALDNLLAELESLDFYSQAPPKSLGTEWVDENIRPLLKKYDGQKQEDLMATWYEHAATRISNDLNTHKAKKILFTGGGVKNKYLMSLLQKKLEGEIVIPDTNIVDFKEAAGFAYLGILRLLGLPNCLASVTGARRDNSSGVIHPV